MKNALSGVFICLSSVAFSQSGKKSPLLHLPKMFSNNMVLQRGINAAVWGWAAPNTIVTIKLAGTITQANVNENGKWMARLPVSNAGGPFTLQISDKDTLSFTNVMIGDVWLASGQSNMAWQLGWGVDNGKQAISNATNFNIRFLTVEDELNNLPQQDIAGGSWIVSDTNTAPKFSAAAYFFALDLQNKLNVPIGIIHSSWGGTDIEAWMSNEILKTHPDYAAVLKKQSDEIKNFDNCYKVVVAINKLRDSIISKANNGIKAKVFAVKYNDANWRTMKLPCKWSDYGLQKFYGYCWFRKSIKLPAAYTGKDYLLSLGEICCDNICYVNGKQIKLENTNSAVLYRIPAKFLKQGTNNITLRILGRWGVGAFNSPNEMVYVEATDKSFKISLANEWKYNETIEPATPEWNEYYNYPTLIYNAKIAPLIPYSLKGIIWYQGENNSKRPKGYDTLFSMLINDWRTKWGLGYMPFIFAQLSNYGVKNIEPTASNNVAELREAQASALQLLNTSMVVNIDLGTDGDVHFRNKQANGKRFALAAMGIAYNEPIEYSGPIYAASIIDADTIHIQFLHAANGLLSKNNEPLKAFVIAGKDKIWKWAHAAIIGNEVKVWSPEVQKPLYVRYGWDDNPDCNLYNKEGLPGAPFRTDKEE